jgi:hypothetical protein
MLHQSIQRDRYNEIKIPWKTSRKIEIVETAPEIQNDPIHDNKVIRQIKFRPIFRIYSGRKKFKLTKTILVKIYRDEDIFFVESEKLLLYGTGDNTEEAIQDFNLHIIHFYEYYKNIDPNKLTKKALKLKKFYTNLLIEE